MTGLNAWLQEALGLSEMTVARIAASLLVIILLWLVRRLILSIIWRRIDDVKVRYRWRKTTTYVLVPIGLLIVGRTWFEGVGSVATYLGLLSAGLAIALKDLVVNLAG